jgi:hypothetical protein
MENLQSRQNQDRLVADAKMKIQALVDQLSDGHQQLRDPKVQTVFQISAQVLNGLVLAFSGLEGKSEAHFPEQTGSAKLHGDKGDHQ